MSAAFWGCPGFSGSDAEELHQSAARWNIFMRKEGREMRPGNSFKISFESRSENEGFAEDVAGAFLLPLDPVVEEVVEIKTAVSEAVSNSVIHGYRGGEGTIYMECEYSAEGRVRICIRDEGVGMPDVEQAMEPLYTTNTDGERSGMGFTVMESFTDRLTVK